MDLNASRLQTCPDFRVPHPMRMRVKRADEISPERRGSGVPGEGESTAHFEPLNAFDALNDLNGLNGWNDWNDRCVNAQRAAFQSAQ